MNDATSRAYSPSIDFVYDPTDTHFDEANLFYHISDFRSNFWNALGFSAFTQITAHAHTVFPSPNAEYDGTTKQLYFSDGQGVTGFNDFAKEDKVIMHEYTHAVTHHIVDLASGYNETGAIDEGNSDYFAGTYTGRTLINEYCCAGYPSLQRNMADPKIVDYAEYQNQQGYPNVEPHLGSELWSATLWDLRSNPNVGSYYSNRDIFYGLYGIPTNSTFLQYRQAIINADYNYFGGAHVNAIEDVFAIRGLGDPSTPSISGPTHLSIGQQGTWTVSTDWGSGSYSYAWYLKSNSTNGQWAEVGTGNPYSTTMENNDGNIGLQCTVTAQITRDDGSIGTIQSSGLINVVCSDCTPCPGCPQAAGRSSSPEVSNLPKDYLLGQNFPNPFNPATEISFALPKDSYVRLIVYDMLGRQVATIIDGEISAGFHTVGWNAGRLASGIYIYKFSAGGFVQTKRMLLMK